MEKTVEMEAIRVKQVVSDTDKGNIARTILESLPDWFGIPEARQQSVSDLRYGDLRWRKYGDQT